MNINESNEYKLASHSSQIKPLACLCIIIFVLTCYFLLHFGKRGSVKMLLMRIIRNNCKHCSTHMRLWCNRGVTLYLSTALCHCSGRFSAGARTKMLSKAVLYPGLGYCYLSIKASVGPSNCQSYLLP